MKLALFLISLALASPKRLNVDYMASADGESVLKMQCQQNSFGGLTCKATEARVTRAEEVQRHFFPLTRMMLALKTDEKKEKEEVEKLKDPAYLAEQKAEICRKEERDHYKFRGAFHKNYDAFLEEAKKAQARICKSTTGVEFLSTVKEREALSESVCELAYEDHEMRLAVVTSGEWEEKQGGWTGDETYKHCSVGETRKLWCTPDKKCEYSRTMTGKREEANKLSFFRSPRQIACEDPPLGKITIFSPKHSRRPPRRCRYLLDRYRDSECCAFED